MKRISLFAGHYGSGKTNIAVNFALQLRKQGLPVVVADLDIVNPYFRTKDSIEELRSAGIEFISSEYAGTNVDFPAIPGEMYSLVDQKDRYAVLDIGGDDRGAYALGRYKDAILEEDDYEMYFVINKYRPLTKTPELTVGIKDEIEQACGMRFTKIINNSNLGGATTPEDVLDSLDYAQRVSEITGLEIAYTTVEESVFEKLDKSLQTKRVSNLFPITLQYKIFEEV